MIYLTVKEVADLKGCSERSIQSCASKGTINAKIDTTQNNRKKFIIPISELSTHEQFKYYKSHNIEIPEELLAGRKPKAQRPHKEFDEFSAEQREEIAQWIRILKAWDEYCATSKLQKVPATEKFVQMQKIANPELNISKGILYRKKAALKADDLAGLIDNRGSWKKGTSSIPDVAWECFLYFYLDEAQHPIQACIDYTRMRFQMFLNTNFLIQSIISSFPSTFCYAKSKQKSLPTLPMFRMSFLKQSFRRKELSFLKVK